MTALAIILDGPEPMQAVRVKGQLQWVPLHETGTAQAVERAAPKVVPCEHCGTMKPAGAKYHAAVHVNHEGRQCRHGMRPRFDCAGRNVPPPCCWEGEP